MNLSFDSLLERLFDHMPMGVAIFDTQLRLQRCNLAWTAYIERYTSSTAVQVQPGVTFFDLAPGAEDEMLPIFERVLAGETVRRDGLRRESQGIVSYWDVFLTPLIEGEEVVGFVEMTTDATERKRVEDALRESEANFRSLLENASNFAVYRVAVDTANPYAGRVMMVSPSIKEITGISDPYRFESWFENIHPEDLPKAVEANRRAMKEGRPYRQSVRVYHPQKEQWIWVHVASTPVFDAAGQLTHFNGLILDITEQKQAEEALQLAYQTMEQRVRERTRELSTLLQVSHNVAATLEMKPLLGLILDQLGGVVHYSGATILALAEDALTVLAHRGPNPREEMLSLRFPLAQAPVNREVLRRREPVIIPDVRGDTPLARAFQKSAGEQLKTTFGYIRSWMGVPLLVKERVIGMLTLDHSEPDHYTPQQAELVRTFANQVAVAIENARLHQAEQTRQRELQTLLDVTAAATASLDLDEMLQATLDRLAALVQASRAGVMLLNSESGELEPRMLRPPQVVAPENMAEVTAACRAALDSGQPLYIPPDAERGFTEPGALLPLRARGQGLGVLAIIGAPGKTFSRQHLALFESIADQLGIAVENARLYEQAEQAAAAAERSRLARDLHDAVSQTLFSASLIAEVLPRLWERNPAEGRRRLEELRELTRGALAEMRALLLELRPLTLTEFSLEELLRQLAEAAIGRSRLQVEVAAVGERPLPPKVQVAFYRIAQESLHNISKHAGASRATLRLDFQPDAVRMTVEDDGRGFDVQDTPPDSFGLSIMRERAAKIGADFHIESEIGQGTRVVIDWPVFGER